MLKVKRTIFVLWVLLLTISLVFITSCKQQDEPEEEEINPDDTTNPDDTPNSVSIVVVNNSNNLIRFLLAISYEFVCYYDIGGIYLCKDEENLIEVIIEIESSNTANHTIDLGDDLSAIRDWFLQFEEPGFPDDWRNFVGIP